MNGVYMEIKKVICSKSYNKSYTIIYHNIAL